jgi:hypothetical protein
MRRSRAVSIDSIKTAMRNLLSHHYRLCTQYPAGPSWEFVRHMFSGQERIDVPFATLFWTDCLMA